MSTRIARGFAWNQLYKFTEYGLMYLYQVLVMRVFGPELAGSYAVYLSIGAALAIIGSVGVDGALLRYLPRLANGEHRYGDVEYGGIRPFLWHLLAFRLLITVALVALVIVLLGVIPEYIPAYAASLGSIRQLVPFFAIYLVGQAITAFSAFALIGLLETKWVFIGSLISRSAIVLVGAATILDKHMTLEWAAGIHAVAALVNGLLLLFWVYKKVGQEEERGLRREAKQVLQHFLNFVRSPRAARGFLLLPFMVYGITTWGNDILSTVLGRQPDILMMRAMLGENAKDIGLYHCASMIVLISEYFFLFGFVGPLVSVFSQLAHEDEQVTQKRSYPRLAQARKDVAGFQSVMTAPLFGFMMVFAPLVVQAIYGSKYIGAEPLIVVSISMVSVSVVFLGGGMHITSLVAIRKERWVFRNRLSWGLFNCAINYFLIGNFGALGAIIGTQFCNTAACATESWYATKMIGPSMSLKRVLPMTGVALLSIGVAYGVMAFIPRDLPAIVLLAIAASITGITAFGGYAFFRLPDARRVLEKARYIFAKKEVTAPAAL
jgi:O-antigen/teichoic acid export membrane protein